MEHVDGDLTRRQRPTKMRLNGLDHVELRKSNLDLLDLLLDAWPNATAPVVGEADGQKKIEDCLQLGAY
jgi:hypothetical protein